MKHHSSLELRREASEASRARRAVRRACGGLPEDFVVTAQLLTSELVTNAIEHGRGRITVVIDRSDHDVLRVGVSDRSAYAPRRQYRDVDSARGRGLLLVEAFAHTWGVERSTPGKTVWFTLRGTPSSFQSPPARTRAG